MSRMRLGVASDDPPNFRTLIEPGGTGSGDRTSAAPDGAARTDAALTRIRAALARPERLRISTRHRDLPEPTFRIEIRQHPYFTEVPFIWTFSGGGVPLTAPGLERMGGSQLPRSF